MTQQVLKVPQKELQVLIGTTTFLLTEAHKIGKKLYLDSRTYKYWLAIMYLFNFTISIQTDF